MILLIVLNSVFFTFSFNVMAVFYMDPPQTERITSSKRTTNLILIYCLFANKINVYVKLTSTLLISVCVIYNYFSLASDPSLGSCFNDMFTTSINEWNLDLH